MGRTEGLGLMLLLHQLYRVGFSRIPPVTLATVAANVLIYLRVLNPYIKAFIRSPSIQKVCVSSAHVWYKGDWPRLLLAAWFHLDEWHLYYNMVSFVSKGISLERTLGTPYFAYLLLVFSALTNGLLVVLNIGLAELLEDYSYIGSCAAGFSGVIFALKVLTTYYTPVENQRIMGLFTVPSRWACWVELVLIQLIVPRASFTGHLAGILIGLAYVKGPLKLLMDAMWSLVTSVLAGGSHQGGRFQARADTTGFRQDDNRSTRPGQGYTGRGYTTGSSSGSGSGTAYARPGPRNYPDGSASRTGGGENTTGYGASPTLPSYRASDFSGGMSEEEQMRAAMRESMTSGSRDFNHHSGVGATPSAPPYAADSHRLYPDLPPEPSAPPYPENGTHGASVSAEELRRRRLAHLNR